MDTGDAMAIEAEDPRRMAVATVHGGRGYNAQLCGGHQLASVQRLRACGEQCLGWRLKQLETECRDGEMVLDKGVHIIQRFVDMERALQRGAVRHLHAHLCNREERILARGVELPHRLQWRNASNITGDSMSGTALRAAVAIW